MRIAIPKGWSVLLPLLVLSSLACTPQKPPPPVFAPEAVLLEPTPYAGTAACQPCHASEFESHHQSNHAQTLREATVADLGTLAPPPGIVPGEGRFTIDGGRLVAHSATSVLPLQLALGSGKTGITFLAVFKQTSAEIRQSYFPHEKQWHLTPGIQEVSRSLGSAIHKEEATRQCLSCHAVTLPLASLMPEKRFFGVGCESCHGPGAEHVAAMQKGPNGEKPPNLAISSLRGATGTALNTLCGRCHRTEDDVVGMPTASKKMTNRFQPYGLAQSRCFKKSANQLTCVTCHNPHRNASKETKHYEAICVSCHSAPKKVCAVNSNEKCISCHMPNRPVMTHGTISLKMADHFIRIN